MTAPSLQWKAKTVVAWTASGPAATLTCPMDVLGRSAKKSPFIGRYADDSAWLDRDRLCASVSKARRCWVFPPEASAGHRHRPPRGRELWAEVSGFYLA